MDSSRVVSGPDIEWPLTGRDDELHSIATALDDPGGIVLDGGAGIGKTRLAKAALATHTADRVRWVIGTYSARGIPLGAFRPLLGALAEGANSALTCARTALADPGSLLAVDDAHLLDDASATLLHQLAVEHAAGMVVTVRTTARAPGAVTALWKDGLLTRLQIPALTQEHTTALVELVLGGHLETSSAQRLFTATKGNILWLRHLLDGERASRRLMCDAGVWHWVGEPQLGLALTALIETRIGELSDGMRRVLELLALGEPLDVDLLQSLATPAAVEDVADRDLMTVHQVGRRWEARIAHPLYGEAVRARMNRPRARQVRGELVKALVHTGDSHDVLRHAVLAVDSDLPPDPELFLAAATHAALRADQLLAERLLRAARDCAAGCDAQLALAFHLCWQHRGEKAEEEFATAAALADSDPLRLRVAQARAMNLLFLLARQDDAHAVLTVATGYPGAGVELLGAMALFSACAGRLDEAESRARRALEASRLSAQAETYAGWALSIVVGLTGRGDRVSAVAARAMAAARCAPETGVLQHNISWWEFFGLGLAGHLGQAAAAVNRFVSLLSGNVTTIFQPVLEAWLALFAGRVSAAVAPLRDFRAYLPGHGGGWTTMLELTLAQAQAMTGDVAGAREALERAQTWRHPGMTFIDPQFALTQARLAAAEGATSTAIGHARQSATQAAQSGQLAIEVLARHAAVSFGDRAQAFRLAQLAQQVDGPRAPAAAAHAAALAAQNPTALLAASGRLAAVQLMLPAAEAAAQATTLHRQQGDLAAAAAATSRTAELTLACDGALTPALRSAAQPLPISDRQREIAAMAAQLCNREIAQRLGISVRTVEGHIYHACVKLGLPDRRALATLFPPAPNHQ
jgi:DNA-binding CsgD family transcriptional regulator